MAGITETTMNTAVAWLTQHGHGLEAIAHPDGDEARTLAAVALHLNLGAQPETAELIVDAIAYIHSGGQTCTYVGAMTG